MESRILYLDQELDETSLRVRKSILEAGCEGRLEYFPNDKSLLERLLGPLEDVMLAIIRVRDTEHLMQLAIHSMFLRGLRVVVVLPEMTQEAVTVAHIFHPTLVLSAADDLSEVAAVVAKLASTEQESDHEVQGRPSNWGRAAMGPR